MVPEAEVANRSDFGENEVQRILDGIVQQMFVGFFSFEK